MTWCRVFDGWYSSDGSYKLRGPMMGQAMWWLYRDGSRYTPTGKFEDAMSFGTAEAGKLYVEALELPPGEGE